MHGFLAAFLACAWHYFGRTGDRTLAWGMVALLGTGFLLQGTASFVNSDLGMCAFVWAVVALVDSDDPWSLKRTGLIGALGLLAILYRMAAVPIAAAAILFAFVRRAVRGEMIRPARNPCRIGLRQRNTVTLSPTPPSQAWVIASRMSIAVSKVEGRGGPAPHVGGGKAVMTTAIEPPGGMLPAPGLALQPIGLT